MMSGRRRLPLYRLRGKPLIIVYILGFRKVILLVGGLLYGGYGKLRLRNRNDNLIPRMKGGALLQPLIKRQHFLYQKPVAVGYNGKSISGLNLVHLILFRVLRHHINGFLRRGNHIGRYISLHNLHPVGEFHIL